MAVPDFQSFFRPVLELACHQEFTAAEMTDAASDRLNLSDSDRSERTAQGTRTRAEDRVRWSFTYLLQAGFVDRPSRGRYRTSAAGKDLLASTPGKITISDLSRSSRFREFISRTTPTSGPYKPAALGAGDSTSAANTNDVLSKSETPLERIESAEAELKKAVASDLLDRTRMLDPTAFEQLIVDLLVKMGFGGSRTDAGARIGKSGDGGVDGIIQEDALGLDAVYIQAKRYDASNVIEAEKIRAFAGALLGQGATKGVFVTTSRFTKGALEEAKKVASQ